jgi:hypothetical protein
MASQQAPASSAALAMGLLSKGPLPYPELGIVASPQSDCHGAGNAQRNSIASENFLEN